MAINVAADKLVNSVLLADVINCITMSISKNNQEDTILKE
jgi:hypothetical protein